MGFSLNLFIIIADQFMLFIINVLVARHVGEELFGDFTVATNALLLLATIITFGIDSIIAYYVPKFYVKKKYNEISGLALSVSTFLKPIYLTFITASLFLSLSVVALSQAIEDVELFEISHPFFLFLWGSVALSLYTIYLQFFRAVDYMRTAVILSLVQTICYFILSLVTYFYLYPKFFHGNKLYFPHVMLIGFILSYVFVVGLSAFIRAKSQLQQVLPKPTVRNAYQYEWKDKIYGYTVQNLNKYLFTAIPLLVIEWLKFDEQSVGLFSAVTSIISLAFIAISPIGILIGPDISAAFAQSKDVLKRTMIKYLLICGAISLVIVVIMGLFAEQILLLYQSNFIKALPYVYICLVNVITYAISMPLAKMIQYSKEGSQVGAKLTIYLLLFQLVSCLILIPRFDLEGAVICYVGINILYNAAMIIMAFRIYRIDSFENEDINDDVKESIMAIQ